LTLAVFGFLVVGNLFSLDIRSPQTLFPFNQGPTLYNRQKIVDYITYLPCAQRKRGAGTF